MKKYLRKKLIELFELWSGETAQNVNKLPQSGSSREYIRISGDRKSAIGTYNDDFEEFYFEYKMGTSKKTGNIKLYENEKLNSEVVQSKENDPIKKTFYEEEQPKQSWFEENKKTILITAGVGFDVAITTIFTVMLLNSN